jgi:carboxymethylenebutenolidase
LKDGFVNYETRDGQAEAYRSDPRSGRPLGQVVVIHEVWGLTQSIRDACERLSRDGFLAVAPVLYWRDQQLFSPERIREGMKLVWGLTLEERYRPRLLAAALTKGHASKETRSMLRTFYDKGFRRLLLQDLRSLANHMRKESPDLRTGAMGFSMGGKLALQLAESSPEIAACVAYSSDPVRGAAVGQTRRPLLLFYGSEDRFMTRNLGAFVQEAAAKGRELALKIYPSAGHEFFDPGNKKEYRAGAAEDAWETSIDFLLKRLSSTAGR